MKRLLIVLLTCVAAFAAAPNDARAADCGLPGNKRPLWIDFADGNVPYWPMFARPGVIAAAANFIYPPRLREMGAKTVYWEMNLRLRVGIPTRPMRRDLVEDWADRVFYRAVASSACARPWIALNEMWGANLPAPWSESNTQYRANVLAFVRRLSALGAKPFMLLSTRPFTDGEAGNWWRETAQYTTFVREAYVPAPLFHRQGPILSSRNLRRVFRQGITDLTSAGVPVAKVGLILGFHTNPGTGGRENLKPASAWFNHIKLQVLAVKQVAREYPLRTIWSWGWGEWAPSDRDPDKPAAACVWLWTRNPALCHAPSMAGRGFSTDLTIGQLRFPPGVQCKTPWGKVRANALAAAARVTREREIALTSVFAHAVLRNQFPITSRDLRDAQRTVIASAFRGSTAAYRRALVRAGATRALARSVIADQVRQVRIARRFAVPAPSGGAIADYRLASSGKLARLVEVTPRAPWLGRKRRGVAIEGSAPGQVFRIPAGREVEVHTGTGVYKIRALGRADRLGTFPLDQARSSIRATLTKAARDQRFDRWLMSKQVSAHAYTICRRDWLPAVGTLELTDSLPCRALPG